MAAGAFVLGAFLLAAHPAAAADSFSGSEANGFGRLLFTLDPQGDAAPTLSGGVLTIQFTRKPDFDPQAIVKSLPQYVSTVRSDDAGKTLRLALQVPVRLHTSQSGTMTAIDLLPQSFAGAAPDLPPPPRKNAKPEIDPATLPVLGLTANANAERTRLMFPWSERVSWHLKRNKDALSIRFSAPARADFSALQRQNPPWVKPRGWSIVDGKLDVRFSVEPGSKIRAVRSGTNVMLDVSAPETDTSVIARNLARETGASPAQIEAVAKAAARVNGTDGTILDPPVPVPNPVALEQAAQRAAEEAHPAVAAEQTADGVSLRIAGAGAHAVAAFVRGRNAWIVLDGDFPISTEQLKTGLGEFPDSVDVTKSAASTIIRIGLKQQDLITARGRSGDLIVQLGPKVKAEPLAIGFTRRESENGLTAMTTLLPGGDHVITLNDPSAGDSLLIVPGFAGRAVTEPRHFLEFELLPTAAGIVIRPLTDDLAVRANDSRATIARPGGLTLTPPSLPPAQTAAALASGGNGPTFLNLAHWPKADGEHFLKEERALRDRIAAAGRDGANRARLQLARFYLANDFAAETLGLLDQMQQSDPALQGDAHLQTMRAAADLMMARYKNAHNDLAGANLEGDRHAALWRGLADAGLENWGDAAHALAIAAPVLNRYPPEWQARARLAMARAGIAEGNIEAADAALAKLPATLPQKLMLQAQLVRADLYARENRYRDAHHLYAAVMTGGDEKAAARAIYGDTEAGLAAGAISRKRAIDTLESLRYRWRGDLIELKTLRQLGKLYFAGQQWREGLNTLRIAARAFPDSDLAREAEDDMRSTFETLFLKGGADKMRPVDALALFYDFIALTPIGPDGDEMIRHMADRLAKIDLLGPASNLLHYQVTKRLDGVARAQVAAKLAGYYLLDQKPDEAFSILRQTTLSTLPGDLSLQRQLLEARALAGMKQWDHALELLAADSSPAAAKLRAGIYWDSGRWADAAKTGEANLGQRWQDQTPLSASERNQVMRVAIAASLAGDEAALNRLRSHFGAKMAGTPDANAFSVVTQEVDLHGLAFRDIAAKVASTGTLDDFMKDFHSADKTITN